MRGRRHSALHSALPCLRSQVPRLPTMTSVNAGRRGTTIMCRVYAYIYIGRTAVRCNWLYATSRRWCFWQEASNTLLYTRVQCPAEWPRGPVSKPTIYYIYIYVYFEYIYFTRCTYYNDTVAYECAYIRTYIHIGYKIKATLLNGRQTYRRVLSSSTTRPNKML